jgi:predicted  nucleic acid-binding Zn-ribbon protein
MKWNSTIAASVVALLLTTACEKKSGANATASVGDKKVDVDVSFAKKDDLASKMKGELSNVNAEIDRLSNKASNSTENASSDTKSRLDQLKDKAKNLNVEIDKVQNATESTWNDVKASSKKALSEAKDSFRDAKDWTAQKLQEAGQKLESK